MTTENQTNNVEETIAQTAGENLNLSQKQAVKFAKQAQALRHNLLLRRQQQEERAKKEIK